MVRFEKTNNQIILNDSDNKIFFVMKKDSNQNINIYLINIIERLDANFCRYANDFVISKRENKIFYSLLEELYHSFIGKINENPKRYNIKVDNDLEHNYSLYRTVSGDKKEVRYPSDSELPNLAASIGLIKYDAENYIFRFHHSFKKTYNSKVVLKKDGSRFPELYELYDNLYEKLMKVNTNNEQSINGNDIDSLIKSMYETFTNLEKSNSRFSNDSSVLNDISNLRTKLRQLELLIYAKTNDKQYRL